MDQWFEDPRTGHCDLPPAPVAEKRREQLPPTTRMVQFQCRKQKLVLPQKGRQKWNTRKK